MQKRDTKTSGKASGNTPAQLVRSNNRWREGYNPLRGLVMARVVALLEAGERGEFAELQWLYRFVERRYPVLRSLVMRRRAAISKLTWTVRVNEELLGGGQTASADGKKSETPAEVKRLMELAEKQRQYLHSQYSKIKNLKRAIRHLALAEFRGFAICQKHRDEAGDVRELHWLPQWNWVRDGNFGDWFWNAEARSGGWQGLGEEARVAAQGSGVRGQESAGGQGAGLLREDFVIREVEMPIDEIGVTAFLRSNLGQKDWDAFIELFGLPGCIVMMPPNIPPGKEEDYHRAAESVAEGSSGALPNGADAKFPTSGVRMGAPFKEHMEWQEKDVVLAGTGGKLTMLTGPTGLGGGQAEVHEDVFDEIATAEAGEISEVLHEDFDLVELERAFPGQPALVSFALVPVDKTADLTKAFKRDVFKAFLNDGTVVDILANQTDLKALTKDVELPVNEEYVDPYVPVADANGVPVTGELLRDSEKDIIGAALPGRMAQGAPAVQAADPVEPTAVADPAKAIGAPVTEDVQATALNGAQVQALADLADQVAQGQIPVETAKALATAAFPLVGAALIEKIFAPLSSFQPAQAPVPAAADPVTKVQGEGVINRWVRRVKKFVNREPDHSPNEKKDQGSDPNSMVAQAVADDLTPVRERLERILEIEDATLLQEKLRAFAVELEQMKEDLGKDPETARAIEQLLVGGLVEGMANKS